YLHAFQVKRTAGILLLQANAAKDKGDLKSEANYLSRYLAFDPKNGEVTAQYALLVAEDKLASNPKAMHHAYFTLEHALRLDPNRHDVRRKVIQVAMHVWIARFNDAAEHIDAFRKMRIEDAELLGWRAICHEAAKEYKQARASYEAALKLPKKQEEHYIRLASLLRQEPFNTGETEKSDDEIIALADQSVEDMLTVFPESFAAYLLSADYYKHFGFAKEQEKKANLQANATTVSLLASPQSAGQVAAIAVVFADKRDLRWERIARDILKAVALAPREAAVLLAAAELETHLHKPKEAREYLKSGIELFPNDWRMYQGMARLEMDQKNPEAAVATLKSGLAKLPKNLDLLWNLAHLHLQLGQNHQADELIAHLGKVSFPKREMDYLQARLLLNKEEWMQAVRILERIIPQLTGVFDKQQDWFSRNLAQECKFMLALCFQRMGDPDRAATTYGVIVHSNPLSGAGWLGLARMEWAIGSYDKALSKYKQAMQLPQAPAAAWVECAQLLIQRNLQTTPADPKEAQAKWKEVEDLLDQAAQIKQAAMEVAILKAEVMAAKNQFDMAGALLEKEYADPATRPTEVWVKIAALEEASGKNNASKLALAILNEAERRVGDHLEIRIGRARYWARQGGSDAVNALAYLGQGMEKWTLDEQRRLTEELADAYVRIGEIKLAQGAWGKLAGQRPNDVGSRLMLFELALQDGVETVMAKMVEELKGIESDDGTLWKYAKASHLILQAEKLTGKKPLVEADKKARAKAEKHLEEAEKLLAVVAGRRAMWYRVPIAQAHIHEQRGQYREAMEKYRQAILWGSQNQQVIRRAVVLLAAHGKIHEADEVLHKLKQMTGSVGDLNRVAAEVAVARRDPQALDTARKAVSEESTDYRDQIWLGHIYWAAGKNFKAEERLRKAVDLASANPEPWVALVQFFIRLGDKTQAVAEIEKAEKAVSDEKGLLPLAYCNELAGRVDVAKQKYKDALNAKPDDVAVLQAAALFHLRQREPEIAKVYLEKILALKSGTPTEIAQARRALALVLAASGSYQQTQKALEILGFTTETVQISDAEAKSNLTDERAKLIILARQPNPRQRKQAIAILEKIRQLKEMTGDEQFLLAQLYESVGEWPKAKVEMADLLNATEKKINKQKGIGSLDTSFKTYLAHHCNALLRRGAADEVSKWLTKLETVEKDSFRTLSIKARLSGKQNEKVVGELTTWADKNPDFKLQVASLLEEIGQQDAAEKMYEDAVKESRSKTPENKLILALYLGRQKGPDKALAKCDEAWADCKPEAVASASVMIIYSTKSTEHQWRLVAGWLDKEIEKKPSKALLNNLAAVRRLQKDYNAQIAICRQILDLDKMDALNMNNLAWTLALHSNDGQQAFKLIERAIELEGPREWLLDTRAVVFMKLGKADQAVADMEEAEAIAESPSASRCFHLAQAYQQANNRQLAVSAFQKAQSLGLDETKVDPLELAAYQQLRQELDK
ncbi:MAG TPA: tetratricopeptide repeat protein, partial [Gemmataceae bacterium]|nr:tetratricopeptide repeat protein [Gemmataceae bacterium]